MYLIDDQKNAELFTLAPKILKAKYEITVDHLGIPELEILLDVMAESLNKKDTKFVIDSHIIKAVYDVDMVSRTEFERQDIYNLISFVMHYRNDH